MLVNLGWCCPTPRLSRDVLGLGFVSAMRDTRSQVLGPQLLTVLQDAAWASTAALCFQEHASRGLQARVGGPVSTTVF